MDPIRPVGPREPGVEPIPAPLPLTPVERERARRERERRRAARRAPTTAAGRPSEPPAGLDVRV